MRDYARAVLTVLKEPLPRTPSMKNSLTLMSVLSCEWSCRARVICIISYKQAAVRSPRNACASQRFLSSRCVPSVPSNLGTPTCPAKSALMLFGRLLRYFELRRPLLFAPRPRPHPDQGGEATARLPQPTIPPSPVRCSVVFLRPWPVTAPRLSAHPHGHEPQLAPQKLKGEGLEIGARVARELELSHDMNDFFAHANRIFRASFKYATD